MFGRNTHRARGQQLNRTNSLSRSWIIGSAIVIAVLATAGTVVVFLVQGPGLAVGTFVVIATIGSFISGLVGNVLTFLQISAPAQAAQAQPAAPTTMKEERGQVVLPLKPAQDDWESIYQVSRFYGREQEQITLKRWILREHARVIAIVGLGGMGKTALAYTVIKQIKQHFTSVFWFSLQNAPPLETFLDKQLLFVLNEQQLHLLQLDEKIALLLQRLKQERCLMVLDNLESILQSGENAGHWKAEFEEYGQLLLRLSEGTHQSCLLLTSREKPQEIARLESATFFVHSLRIGGLDRQASQHLLLDRDIEGPEGLLNQLVDFYNGNPLTLQLLSESIRERSQNNLETFMKHGGMMFSDLQTLLTQHINRLTPLEQEIMYWLAVEREAVSIEDLRKKFIMNVANAEVQEAIVSLQRRSLIEARSPANFALQPVIMEYMTERLIAIVQEEIEGGKIDFLARYPLMQAQGLNYVRESQLRLLVEPIKQYLLSEFGKSKSLEKLGELLALIRRERSERTDYGAGNLLNLLLQMESELHGYDFAHLTVRHADLQNALLIDVNFVEADLSSSVFADAFGGVYSIALNPAKTLLAAGTAHGEVKIWQLETGVPLLTCYDHSLKVRVGTVGGAVEEARRQWEAGTEAVHSVAFSPDGSQILSGGDDEQLRLWDTETGDCLSVLKASVWKIRAVAFSADGKYLACGGMDESIQIWDAQAGEPLRKIPRHGHTGCVNAVAFSPDGKLLVSGSDDTTLQVWEVSTGARRQILRGHTQGVKTVAFSPDGELIASGGDDQTIRIWRSETWENSATWEGHLAGVKAVAFSADGSLIVSGGDDQTVRIWHVADGTCDEILQDHLAEVTSVTFGVDNRMVISGSLDQTVRMWQINTGQCTKILQGYTSCVRSLAFSPDGRVLVSGGDDYMVRVWEVSTGKCLKTLSGHSKRVWRVVFSPDGRLIASSSDDRVIRLWDVGTGQSVRTLRGVIHDTWYIGMAADGRVLAQGVDDPSAQQWEVSTKYDSPVPSQQGSFFAVTSDGGVLANVLDEQAVQLWEMPSGASLRSIESEGAGVMALAFAPDSRLLATGGRDGSIHLWDVQNGAHVRMLKHDRRYERMNISGVKGLTPAQKSSLKEFGAIEESA